MIPCSKGGSLLVLTVNIRSIKANFDFFLMFLLKFTKPVDVIVLTECWTNDQFLPPNINNYRTFRSNVMLNKSDGVVVYVRDMFEASSFEPPCSEGNCIVVNIADDISIICTYRPPCFKNPLSYINSLDNIIKTCSAKKVVILTGDLNLDIMSDNLNTNSALYLNLMASHGLKRGINCPTRQNTCLDHFMVKASAKIETFVFDELTDHSPILLYIDYTPTSKQNTYINKTKIDFSGISKCMENESWNDLYSLSDVNKAARLLTEKLESFISSNTSNKKISKRNNPLKPWITIGVIKSIRKRDRMHKKLKFYLNNLEMKHKYLAYRNILKKVIKTLKTDYYTDKLNKNRDNIKETWKTIKELCNMKLNKTSPTELLNINTNITRSLDDVNDFFATVGSNLAKQILQKLNTDETTLAQNARTKNTPLSSMALYLTDPAEVIDVITSLKSQSAPGIDKITASILKMFRFHLAKPISYLTNLSFEQGVFPEVFKHAIICPVHKSGNKHLPTNYRPISLLSTLSKVVEKIMNKRLIGFMETNKLLGLHQFGFRAKHSTDEAVLHLTNNIISHIDRGDKCLAVFLDLQKAFDTVSIPILLSRLENLGIRGNALLWLRDYLTERYQYVRVENHSSNPCVGSYGVPQGSTLAPTLFLAYVNDLCKFETQGADIQMFADDTVVLFHSNTWDNVQQLAEKVMSHITAWLEDSLLSLNVNKTNFLCFSKTMASSPKIFHLRMHCHPCNRSIIESSTRCNCPKLTRTTEIKYLGVNIDDKLNWKKHINTVSGRLRKLIYIFKDLRIIPDTSLLIQTYKALAECLITYCICSWGSAAKTHLIEVERAQRAVLKVLLNLPFDHPTHLVYEKAEVLSVRKMFVYQCIRKYHKHTVPLLQPSGKRKDKCPIPRVRSKFAQQRYSNIAPRLYNKLNLKYQTRYLSNYQIKRITKIWLGRFGYDDVEDLLSIVT